MNSILATHKGSHQIANDRSLQVMLVDDQEASRLKIRAVLRSLGGFQVAAETATCYDALFLARQTAFDLVIAQFTLQEDKGVELIHQLKQLSPSPHVVVLAPAIQDELLIQAFLAGAEGYLTLDTPTHELCRAFEAFQRGGPAMLPSVSAYIIHLLVEQHKVVEARLAAALQPIMHAVDTVISSSAQVESVQARGDKASISPLDRLSPQEEKVLRLLRHGQSNKQIAAQLAISPYTVGKHVQNILRKLGVSNRTQAAAYTLFQG